MFARFNLSLFVLFFVGLISTKQADAVDLGKAIENFIMFVEECRLKLDVKHIQDISQLREFTAVAATSSNEKIGLARVTYMSISKEVLKGGILKFMLHREEKYANSDEGKKKFEEEFDRHILDPCMALMEKLESITSDYKHVMGSYGALKSLNAISLEWLANSNICSTIVKDIDLFKEQTCQMATKN